VNISLGDEDEPVSNLTPLIDVVFQLLIFFMVATSFLDPEHQIGLELPEAFAGAEQPETREIVVHVRRDGSLALGASDIGADELTAALRRAAAGDPDASVTIRGDRLAHHEAIVAVLDACAAAGLSKLAVGTSEPEGR
jgi:biopolymer transport protein ExbD